MIYGYFLKIAEIDLSEKKVKMLDIIEKAAIDTGAIVVAEEHSIIGGLGGAISEVIGSLSPVPIEFIGIKDTFTQSAVDYNELLDQYKLGTVDIFEAVRRTIKRKK